jgi:N6-adenosine-specific RNA methylase IME4
MTPAERQRRRRERLRSSLRDTSIIADLDDAVREGRRFGCVYCDPPWPYDNQATRAATGNHYLGMTIEELCALPIAQLAADNAHLHLWTTNGFLFETPRLFAAGGLNSQARWFG